MLKLRRDYQTLSTMKADQLSVYFSHAIIWNPCFEGSKMYEVSTK